MGSNFCPDPISVEILHDYVLKIVFEDGKVIVRDFEPHLNKGVFNKLRNKALFSLVHIEHAAIVWNEDFDCAPEFFYYEDPD